MSRPDPADRAPDSPFEALAHLYLPIAPGGRVAPIEPDPDWRWDRTVAWGLDAAVWGRLPLRLSSTRRMLRFAVGREVALASLRLATPGGLRVVRVHRLPPVRRPGRLRNAIRRILMGGLAVELERRARPSDRPERPERAIDAVVAAAGGDVGTVRLRPSGDGSALAQLAGGPGGPVELRVATAGSLKDPSRNAEALRVLAEAGVTPVPRLVDQGTTAGAVWTTETALPGRQPRRLDETLLADARDFAASLPRRPAEPSTAAVDQLLTVAEALPHHRRQLEDLAATLPARAARLGTIVEHGDFWIGNMLVRDGRLSGVIDWDTWHPDGMPGADLLQLRATTLAAGGRGFGELWLAGIWRDRACRALLAPYWAKLGLRPTEAELHAVSIAWWASQAAASWRRGRNPGSDPVWVRHNVDDVLARLREHVVPAVGDQDP